MQGKSPAARQLAARLRELDKTQWWSAEEIAALQFRLARTVFRHAYRTVPFYRRSFDAVGIRPDTLRPETWSQVPILTRSDLQDHDLLSQAIPADHGSIFETKTSGSTGQPVRVKATGLTNFFWRVFTMRDHLWHNRNFAGTLASIRVFDSELPEEGRIFPDWGEPANLFFRTGPAAALQIRTDIDYQLAWLQRISPELLLTYPSNLMALLVRSSELDIRLPSLREVRTVGETVSGHLRDHCRATWGVPLTDLYTSQELGYIALQCPDHGQYHVQAENVLVEILDGQGQPCRPGEIGRLVITSLRNFAMPLIRYEIRDYAEAGAPCPCGRGLPVIRRIVGRQRNMAVLPTGEKLWPTVGFKRYAEVVPVKQYQFVQHSPTELEMRLATARPPTVEEEKRLAAIVQEAMGYPFAITFTYVEAIAQGPNGKFEDFISRIDQ